MERWLREKENDFFLRTEFKNTLKVGKCVLKLLETVCADDCVQLSINFKCMCMFCFT